MRRKRRWRRRRRRRRGACEWRKVGQLSWLGDCTAQWRRNLSGAHQPVAPPYTVAPETAGCLSYASKGGTSVIVIPL